VFLRDFQQWWALIPAGILLIAGLGFLLAENLVQYVGAAVLIILGIIVLARALLGRGPDRSDTSSETPATDEPAGE
ncbi:MAG: hypothetical protein R3335_14965, partial [Anaerolineales bacterium]|nr:hypothetical protein [Anaerolineales bacterium]